LQQNTLKVALPKGRLYDDVVSACLKTELLERAEDVSKLSRKLVQQVSETGHIFLLAKPADVPAYVEHGAADIGFTGRDIIAEEDRDLYEVLDLEVGSCDLVVAVPAEMGVENLDELPDIVRVATSYPAVTQRFFQEKEIKAEIIELNGSVELAPQVDLADIIVDITSTGTTLRRNDLIPVAGVLSSSVRMVVNQTSYRTRRDLISRLCRQMAPSGAEVGEWSKCSF